MGNVHPDVPGVCVLETIRRRFSSLQLSKRRSTFLVGSYSVVNIVTVISDVVYSAVM